MSRARRRYEPDLNPGDAVYFNGHLCKVASMGFGGQTGTPDGWIMIALPKKDTDCIDEAPTDHRYVRRSQLVRA